MGNERQGRKENAEHKRYVEVPSLNQGSEMNGFCLKQGLPLSAPLWGTDSEWKQPKFHLQFFEPIRFKSIKRLDHEILAAFFFAKCH